MKVRTQFCTLAAAGRTVAATAAAFALIITMSPAPASAITRSEILSRADGWVRQGVVYSQTSSHAGYRRDCSGFVSMAWKLPTSYTTRNISGSARRVPLSALRPGDAILQPGHIQIFAGWANRRAGRFIAIEESSWGHPAHRKVKRLPGSGVGLRVRGIEEAVVPSVDSVERGADLLSALPPVMPLPLYVLAPDSGPVTPNDLSRS